MKTNSLLLLALLVIFASCNNSKSEESKIVIENVEDETLSIIGVWERTSFYNYGDNGEIVDSFASNEANRHIKIFTPTKVMWCRNISADSTEWFGYGKYKITDSLLTEILDYGSVEMSKYIQQNPEFVFHYDLGENTYSQIQIDAEGHPLFAENYIRLE